MRLSTILLFAVVGLVVSAPFLFSGPEGQLTDSGESRSIVPGQFGQDVVESDSQQGGFFARLFGGQMTESDSNPDSPFQLAGTNGVSTHDTVSVMGNNTATPPPDAAYSEPVYFAFANLAEFLRFDVSPAWIKFRWPRVSTFPAEDNLTGMRVAVVSGPRPQDIHGSLTYYFDRQQRVQRIGFRGWTGDAVELVHLVQQMGFARQKSNGAALFIKSSWGRIKGALRLDHPPVTRRDLPNEQLMVLFELINPAGKMNVSQKTMSIINAMEGEN